MMKSKISNLKSQIYIVNLKSLISLLVLTCAICVLSLQPVKAATVSNDDFKLQMQTGEPDSYTKFENAPIVPGQEKGTNYIKIVGFPGDSEIDTLFLSLDHSQINFGIIAPTTPVTRTSELTVTSSHVPFYVHVFENGPLKGGESVIPGASCDSGACTDTTPAAWTSPLSFGLGYRCQGIACASGFGDPVTFKQFPSIDAKQPALIATGDKNEEKIQILYKLVIAGSQPKYLYQNIINYIVEPGY